MGAKIMLNGRARNVIKGERSVTFTIITGPATRHPPRGLKLFGPVKYRVECTLRQWGRARCDPDDGSPMIVEGYLEPQRDAQTGEPCIAVVATSLQTTRKRAACQLQQLCEALEEAREAFRRAREAGAPPELLQARAAAFVQANQAFEELLARYPDLDPRR
jgi:PAS domain-containing protein